MLPRSYRLPSSEKFENARNISTQYFRLLVKSNSLTQNRFGFVISKKVDKRAVVRNRLRRVLSEAARGFLENSSGKDVLFIVKLSFYEEPTEKIFALIKEVLEKEL